MFLYCPICEKTEPIHYKRIGKEVYIKLECDNCIKEKLTESKDPFIEKDIQDIKEDTKGIKDDTKNIKDIEKNINNLKRELEKLRKIKTFSKYDIFKIFNKIFSEMEYKNLDGFLDVERAFEDIEPICEECGTPFRYWDKDNFKLAKIEKNINYCRKCGASLDPPYLDERDNYPNENIEDRFIRP